jgi:Asp/Glu/hydantoin racemase
MEGMTMSEKELVRRIAEAEARLRAHACDPDPAAIRSAEAAREALRTLIGILAKRRALGAK